MHHRHVNVAFAFVLLRTERQHTHTRTSLRPIDSKSFETNLFVLTSESINRRVTRATELVLRNTQRVHIDRTTQAFDAHRPSDKSISFISTDIHFDFVKQLQYAPIVHFKINVYLKIVCCYYSTERTRGSLCYLCRRNRNNRIKAKYILIGKTLLAFHSFFNTYTYNTRFMHFS